MTEKEKVMEELSEILRYETISKTLQEMIGMLRNKEAALGRSENIPVPIKPNPPATSVEERYQEKIENAQKNRKALRWLLAGGSMVFLYYFAAILPFPTERSEASELDMIFVYAYLAAFFIVPVIIFILVGKIKPSNVKKPGYTQEEQEKMQVYQFSLNGYQKEMENYKKKIEEDHVRVEQERFTKIQYKKMRENLERDNMLFQRGIQYAYAASSLYPSFQNIDAATAIYQYFCSGQCDTLKEAYNVYGMESRMDKMIGQLDNLQHSLHMIATKLNYIERNQWELLNSMEQSQGVLEGMKRQLSGIESTSKIAAVSSAVDAYYSGVVAKELVKIRETCSS